MISTSSCGKHVILSKNHLSFSKDTVVFDTVFTTIGSTTQQFKIYNKDSKTIRIDEIELMGGSSSKFYMNVDGIKGTKIQDISIEGGDSLFVFVEVTLDPNGGVLPLVIEDSIRFKTNGLDQFVQLAVWGQDAYFHYNEKNEGTWANDKPHVIYGYAAIDSSKTLNIQPDTHIYMHKNAILYVYKSTLNIQGALGHEVIIEGDRLEQAYKDVSGQFYGIYFHQAKPCTIDYAIIKNGTSGVHLYDEDPANSNYTLTMTNTIIKNQARYGVFIYAGARVKAENCIVAKNGTHALFVLQGGDFNFNQCDLLGYGSSTNPAVGISNYYTDQSAGQTNVSSINEGKLYNCVVTGNLTTEFAMDTIQMSGVVLNFDIRNTLLRSEHIYTDSFYDASVLWNGSPSFTDPDAFDFSFGVNSDLQGNGFTTAVINDIFGNARNNPPDIGAIEN
ncbi:MAG: right-handed parallel beta-helix repeat-containing protein [Flavobacteriales bacterium]